MATHTFQSESLISMRKGRGAALMLAINTEAHDEHGTEFLGGMRMVHPADVEKSLDKRRLLVLPARKQHVHCLSGELWITRDGDIKDYILEPGQQMAVSADAQAVVYALQSSRFRLSVD